MFDKIYWKYLKCVKVTTFCNKHKIDLALNKVNKLKNH